MRILILISSMDPRAGGPPRVIYGSAVALRRAGFTVSVAATCVDGDEALVRQAWPELVELGIPLNLFPVSSPRRLGDSAALIDFLRRNLAGYDMLHVHGIWERVLLRAAAVFDRADLPYVISPHGMLDIWQMKRSRIKKGIVLHMLGGYRFLRRASAILYGSTEEAKEASGLSLPGRVVTMPNGVDLSEIDDIQPEAVAALRKRFPMLKQWSRTLLFFSRVHPKKGLDLLIDALARIHQDFPGVGLFAAGIAQDRDYEMQIRRQIAAFGLQESVLLTTDLTGRAAKAAFGICDIFCLPSYQEGFSMAIIEAMGARKPVLITEKCHMPEIGSEGAGMTVTASVDGIELGLRTLLALDNSALAGAGRRARQLVVDRYTWDRVGERLAETYYQVVAGRRRRR